MACALLAMTAIAEEIEVDYYHPKNLLKFADALYQQGDYLRAAGEYQRYLFYKPQDSDRILYQAAMSYRLGGQADRALQFFEILLKENPRGGFASVAHYEIGLSYFLMEQYNQSLSFLKEAQNRIDDENYRWKSRQLTGLNYLMQKRWDDASLFFHQLDLEKLPSGLRETVPIYRKYAEDGKHLPSKNPILAGLFSTIIPGTGKIYTGRANDALFTVLILGLTGWQAYDGFHRDGTSSTKGWVFGTISGIFYLGNVYGSVVTAQIYNRRVEDEFLAKISLEIP